MRVVAALGGNALLQRGQPMTAQTQRVNVKRAAQALATIAKNNELIITHGNGPQIGLLALQGLAYDKVESYPMDVLNAETEGMIGYMIEQELSNLLPPERSVASLLTMVEVAADDPAFSNPSKPIGPLYERAEALRLAKTHSWTIGRDGDLFRRVVASPQPKRIIEIQPIRWLLEKNCIVICAGGGGIPILNDAEHRLVGVEAVIDKDHCSSLLAQQLNADILLLLTDVAAVYKDWRTNQQQAIKQATPAALRQLELAAGSMAPKVEAACEFVEKSAKIAGIGSLQEAAAVLAGMAGTTVASAKSEVLF